MNINYELLPEESKALVDCLEIANKVGNDKQACLAEIDSEVNSTKLAIQQSRNVADRDSLFFYLKRLFNARRTLTSYFA